MGILQDKKWPIVFALIVMIVGSIMYFTMDASREKLMEEKNDAISDAINNTQAQYGDESPNNPNIPMIENEAII